MKVHLKLLSLALLFSGAAATVAAAYPATATSDLNVRTGPGTGYRVITTLAAGERVEVMNCSGSWCEIDFGGGSGYASAGYLARGGYAYRPLVVVAPRPYIIQRDYDYYDRRNYNYRDDYPWGYRSSRPSYRHRDRDYSRSQRSSAPAVQRQTGRELRRAPYGATSDSQQLNEQRQQLLREQLEQTAPPPP